MRIDQLRDAVNEIAKEAIREHMENCFEIDIVCDECGKGLRTVKAESTGGAYRLAYDSIEDGERCECGGWIDIRPVPQHTRLGR